jgi:hypothetical protein
MLDEPRTAIIPLGARGQYEAIVDADDYAFLTQWRWHYSRSRGGNIYAKRSTRRGSLYMHRVILERAAGPAPSPEHTCDHINGDPLNNRRSNLRWATKSEQEANKPKKRRNFAIEAFADYVREAAE